MNLLKLVAVSADLKGLAARILAAQGTPADPSECEQALSRFVTVADELLEAALAPTVPPGQDASGGLGEMAARSAECALAAYRVARTGEDRVARNVAGEYEKYFDDRPDALSALTEWSAARPG